MFSLNVNSALVKAMTQTKRDELARYEPHTHASRQALHTLTKYTNYDLVAPLHNKNYAILLFKNDIRVSTSQNFPDFLKQF